MAGTRRPQNGYRKGGKQAYHGGARTKTFAATSRNEATSADERKEATRLAHSIDESMGFGRYDSGKKKMGWLVNLQPTEIEDEGNPRGRAALDLYFLEEDGGTFKATIEYEPYFLVAVKRGYEPEAEEWLKRAPGGGVVKSVRRVEKEDLKMPNHLLGYRRTFLELRFLNVNDLLAARRDIIPIAEKNKKQMNAMDTYAEVARYVSVEFFWGSWANEGMPVQVLDLTYLMIHEKIINDLIRRLWMPAISLLMLESGMFHIMCGFSLIKVREVPSGGIPGWNICG
jgi:DNA polymerase epsilon subunit 1